MIEILGADAYFLWEESRARHMHTLKIVIVAPRSAAGRVDLEKVKLGAVTLLPYFKAFRRRAVASPLGIGHPVWVDAPELDVDYHIRHERLPEGGGEEALDTLLGQIASEPLDRAHPLWQLFFVEGLSGGRVAYVTKLHHAVADGGAAAQLVLRSFHADPTPRELPEPYPGVNESIPSAGKRLAAALRRELVRQGELPGVAARSLKAMANSLRGILRREPRPPSPFSSPATRFNRTLTPNRICARATLALPQMRSVKQAFGCTLNDVYIAVVGGALRQYLEHHAELEGNALTATIPVSVRRPEDDPSFGNAVAYWFASTACDVADPVERLQVVTQSTRASRAHFEAGDTRLAIDWLDHWPLRQVYLDGLQVIARAITQRPSYSVIVSNVRGPDHRLYSNGGRIEALYSIGPLSLQQGLNFTAWSYMDDFAVGLHACREHVPDLRRLADALPEELEALVKRVES
jgi:WS/DGAT/MGAT family acyltransferase